jgi:ABC-type antimicrobial peptide transport system permease subunit
MSRWEQIIVVPGTRFFTIFQKVIKQLKDGQTDITIKVPDQERSNKYNEPIEEVYKFVIQYQDDDINISGIDVFKLFKE